MSEDGEKDTEKEQGSSSRPSNAAARRERRASARAGTGSDAKAGKAAPKGKAGSGPEKGKSAGKDRPTPKRGGTATAEKRSLFSRLVLFLREVWGELRKVIWPTRKQMVTYTAVVLVFVAFMIALVYLLDFVFLEGVDVVFGD